MKGIGYTKWSQLFMFLDGDKFGFLRWKIEKDELTWSLYWTN